MNKLALGALLVASIAACGGGKTTLIDGAVDALMACNPVMQTGCQTGEKCTWIVDIDGNPTAMTEDIGHIGCVANGSIVEGAGCTDGSMAGPDACVAGQLCVSGKCKQICDPQVVEGTAAAGACPKDFSCSVYAGVFESGGDPTAGVCDIGCDPLTQKLKVGTTNLEACGSPSPTAPNATCVPSRGFLSFHCAPSGNIVYNNTDRKPPLTDSAGRPYGNGCAPGYIPFYFMDASGSMTTWCSGLCAPMKVDATIAAQAEHTTDNQGDKTALGKLIADAAPVAGHAVCTPTVKGASDIQSSKGQDCRFLWYPLAGGGGDPNMASMSPFNDSLGVCFAYEKFLTVIVEGMTQRLPEKSCAELPVTAPDGDPYGSAKESGCYSLADSKLPPSGARKRAINYRLGYGGGLAVRHVFD
jgi:hypothetical protein